MNLWNLIRIWTALFLFATWPVVAVVAADDDPMAEVPAASTGAPADPVQAAGSPHTHSGGIETLEDNQLTAEPVSDVPTQPPQSETDATPASAAETPTDPAAPDAEAESAPPNVSGQPVREPPADKLSAPADVTSESTEHTIPDMKETVPDSPLNSAPQAMPEPDGEQIPETESLVKEPEVPAEPVVVIEPEYVRALTHISAGHNDSNPIWSPTGGLIAFERSIGDKREIIITRPNGQEVQRVYYRSKPDEEEMNFFFPGIADEVSYNSGITWSPDEKSLVFMSNGGSGNYDLYLLSELGQVETVRLTHSEEKDSHPHWSPISPQLVFVSGRSGKADIYLMDLSALQVTRLTEGQKTYLYPHWSPDGRKITMIYGSNENHDIFVINDLQRPKESLQALTKWQYDDLRPVWSPDGTKIAFYSNYNPQQDPKIWSLIVIAADGSDPSEGEALVAKVVATNVIPDIERGPAWMTDSRRIVYVKNDEYAYNPIYIADIVEGTDRPLKTETKMNHDVICSSAGLLAFRAQTEQWDHIYIAKLKK